MPGLAIAIEYKIKQTQDNALFCLGEISTLRLWLQAAVPTEQIVHNQKYQGCVEYEQRRTA